MLGECNCGAVAYKAEADVSDVFICHCSMCRKSTGSGGIAVVIVNKASFQWLRGEPHISSWSKPGHDWHTFFCNTCGSPLPGENDANTLYIPAGTICSGDENLRIAHHLYVDSKAPWEEISDSGQHHSGGYQA